MNNRPLHLFLDLDQTCIFARPWENGGVPVGWDPERGRPLFEVAVRPGLLAFLRTVPEESCRLYVWTAGTREYAEEVTRKVLVAAGVPVVCTFHREHCAWSTANFGHPKFVSGLLAAFPHIFGANGVRGVAVLLDDLPEMATWQPHRVVTVPAFVGQPDDAFFSNTDEVWERIHSRGWEQVAGVGKVRVEVGGYVALT